MRVAKILRYVLVGIPILLIALIAGAVVALKYADFNQYKPLIAEEVRKATGRDLAISGDLTLDISLTPGIVVDGVTLSNAEWGSRPEMISVRHLEVQIALASLVFGVVEVKRIELTGADILLETDPRGHANFEFEPLESEAAAAGAGIGAVPLVHEAVIRDSRLTYVSAATGVTYRIDIDSLALRGAGPGDPLGLVYAGGYNNVPIKANATFGALADLLEPGEPWPVDLTVGAGGAAVTVKGTIAEPLTAGGLDLAIAILGDRTSDLSGLAGTEIPSLGAYSLSARVSGGADTAIALTGLRARIGDSDITGEVTATFAGGSPTFDARFASDKIDLAALGVGVNAPLQDVISVYSVQDGKLKIESFNANLSGATITVKGTIAEPAEGKGLNLAVAVAGDQVGDLSALVGAEAPALGAYSLSARVTGDAVSAIKLVGLKAQIGASDLAGEVTVTLDGEHLAVDAKLASRNIDLAAMGAGVNANLRDTVTAISLKKGKLDIKSLKTMVAGATVTVNGTIADAATFEGLNLAVTARGDRFADLSEQIGGNVLALGGYSLAARVTGDPASTIGISGLVAQLGGSDISGNATVTLTGERPFIDASLSSNRIDLAILGGAAGDAGGVGRQEAAKKPERIFPDDPLPLEGLKAVDVDLRFDAATVTGRGAPLRNAAVILSLRGGLLDVESFKAELYDGALDGAVVIDARKETAGLVVKAALQNVDLARIFDETTVAGTAEGHVNFDLDVTGQGNSIRDIMASLDGKVALAMGEGRIKSGTLQRWVGGSTRILTNVLTLNVGGYTTVNCALGVFDIEQGLATSSGLLLDTDVAAFVGNGTVNLGTETLDMIINPKVKKITLSAAVPVHIRGTLANPEYSPDNTAVARRVGGLLGGIVYPPALILGLGELGTFKDGDCTGRAESADGETTPEQTQPTTEQQPSSLPGNILKGTGETITKGLRGLFGQ